MRPLLYLPNQPFVQVPRRTDRMNIVLTASLAASMYLGIASVIFASHLAGNPAPGPLPAVLVARR